MTNMENEGKITNHWLVGLAEVLLVFAGMFLLLFWKRLPPEVPWLYSLPWGGSQLISKIWFALSLPIVMVLGLVNLVMSRRIYRHDMVVAVVIDGAVLLLTVMYLAAFFRVVSIIT
ncbi:MAG: hypothetical protein AAB973_04055 [Patescibacteria group bacterium]